MVACKVVKDASGSLDTAGFAAAEEDLLKDALLMARVEPHTNLVALVGVITRGQTFSSASDVWSFAITCVEIFQV